MAETNKNSDHLRTLRERIIMKGTITPLTSLHIGWKRSFDPAESDAPVIKDPGGNPYIPGSSFKGILRSFIEGFLGGADIEGLKPCFPTDVEYCVEQKNWDKTEYILEHACPVCRLFGSSFMGSKLKIKDMPVKREAWHEMFLRIRDGIVIDRESRTAKDKGKYDFEIVSPDVSFQLEIVGDNLTDGEKGLLFVAFDLISQGFGALGGNVSRGTGRIKIDINRIETLSPREFFRQYKEGQPPPEPRVIPEKEVRPYIQECKNQFFKQYSSEVDHV